MSQAWLNLESARQRREQQQENSARQAAFYQRYTTSGTGETVSGLIRFDTAFTEQPYLATGCVIAQLPDVNYYRYPTVTAGVIRWETEPIGPPPPPTYYTSSPSGATRPDPRQVLYVGAYMVFTVQCDPRNIPNTDGRNHLALKAAMDALVEGTEDHDVAKARYEEAIAARWLRANPARVIVEHHLTFSGVAVKSNQLAKHPALKPGTFSPEVENGRITHF